MRWLISLLSFVEAKYYMYTLKKGNYTNKITQKNSLRMEKPGKIIDTEETTDPGKEAVRTLNPGKTTNTEKILDTGEDVNLYTVFTQI